MNKAELIDAVAVTADLSKTNAARAVDALVDTITSALQSGDTVTLMRLGTFSVRERAARIGRHPKTGAQINIGPSKTPKFKAGKTLKDAIS